MSKLNGYRPQRRNANKHRPYGLKLIADSIQRDGYSAPMVAAADGEIFAGSARLEVAGDVLADAEPIIVHSDGTRPVIHVRDDIPTADDPKARRLGVADNVVARIDYDPDGEILATLADEDDVIRRMVADDNVSMAAVMAAANGDEAGDAEPQIDRAEELRLKWGTERGQLWRIGDHRLLCGDSTVRADVERVMDGAEAKLWICDPPFDISYSQFELFPSVDVCAVWHRSKDALIWMAQQFSDDKWGCHTLVFTGGVRGQHNHTLPCCMHENVIVWRRRWWKEKEEAIDRDVIRSCGCEYTVDGRPISWQQHTGGVVSAQSTGMSWAKPVIESAIVMSYVPRGAVVWDSCAGSGSSLLAAHGHGRIWRGCELNPGWVALCLERFQKSFGLAPSLEV